MVYTVITMASTKKAFRCRAMQFANEAVCVRDEGFIVIPETYAGEKCTVREIDCRANGDRVCRFCGTVSEAVT